jgi:hypothetical protein
MDMDFWNCAEVAIFSEIDYTSAEFREKNYAEFWKKHWSYCIAGEIKTQLYSVFPSHKIIKLNSYLF